MDYRLRLREVFIPVYGNLMYRNRTLDNREFMEDINESTLRKVRRRELVSRVGSGIIIPAGIGFLIGKVL